MTEMQGRTPKLGQVPALTGLRGVAIALVLGTHSGYPFLGGSLGVDVFFVLSGFLISTILLDEWDASGQIRLGQFYARRVLRLYPALVAMIILAGIFHTQLPGHTWRAFWAAALSALFYVANFVVTFSHQGNGMDGFGHTWTLAMEEQFYLLWPLTLLLCLRAGRRWVAVTLAAGILLLSWASLMIFTGPTSLAGASQAYYRPDSRVGGLLVGCLFALAVRHETWRNWANSRWLAYASTFGLMVTIGVAGHGQVDFLRECIPLASVGTVGVISASVFQPRGLIARALSSSPLVWLGQISYGVYVYSVTFNALVEPHLATWRRADRAALLTVCAVLIATVSYLALERPVQRRGRAWLSERERRRVDVGVSAVGSSVA